MDWTKYYSIMPSQFEETDFLRQVGKTFLGRPITAQQFEALVSDVYKALHLNDHDVVLDMCWGNGMITSRIASACARVVGIDVSETLIGIAKRYNNSRNVTYYCMSVLDPEVMAVSGRPFTKICMYEALQHFGEDHLRTLLRGISEISGPEATVFLGSIPDAAKIWDFYDTEERRADYRRRKSENREAIGTWWEKPHIEKIARDNGYRCQFLLQNPLLHTAHYRFDVLLLSLVHQGDATA